MGSLDPSPSAGPSTSTSHPTEDLPSYSGPLPSLVPESITTLNPESVKKLSREAAARGYDVADYGFDMDGGGDTGSGRAGDVLPTFGDSEETGARRTQFQMDSEGNIITHDVTLNSSPLALARFLRLNATAPPSLILNARGSHTERRTETIWTTHNGHRRSRTETKNVEVEDFSFKIDASSYVLQGMGRASGGKGTRGIMYEAGEWEAAYRGGAWRSTGSGPGIKLPSDLEEGREGVMVSKTVRWSEGRRLDKENDERQKRGLPAFVHPSSLVDMDDDTQESNESHPPVLFRSHFVDLVESHSSVPFALSGHSSTHESLIRDGEKRDEDVQRVIEEYCTSTKLLKELTVRRELYGWNWLLLEQALRSTITSTNYLGTIQIQFQTSPNTITIRPENNFSRIFSLPLYAKAILWITLIYPLLLILEIFLGDSFSSLRIAFPLSRWRPLPNSSQISHTEALEIARPISGRVEPKVGQLPRGDGWVYLIGMEEGEFLSHWEGSVVDGVRRGLRGVTLSRSS